MRLLSLLLLVLGHSSVIAQFTEKREGYAIVRGERIEGQLALNFDAGSLLLSTESTNKVFLSGVEKIVFSDNNDTYLIEEINGKNVFLKILIDGKLPLYESQGKYYCRLDDGVVEIEKDSKAFYSLFGKKKKEIKDYVFVHNISYENEDGMIEVFEHYNSEFPVF